MVALNVLRGLASLIPGLGGAAYVGSQKPEGIEEVFKAATGTAGISRASESLTKEINVKKVADRLKAAGVDPETADKIAQGAIGQFGDAVIGDDEASTIAQDIGRGLEGGKPSGSAMIDFGGIMAMKDNLPEKKKDEEEEEKKLDPDFEPDLSNIPTKDEKEDKEKPVVPTTLTVAEEKQNDLARIINKHLTPDLLGKNYRKDQPCKAGDTTGHCFIATQAAWFELGGKESGYVPRMLTHKEFPEALKPGETHHYLINPDTKEVIDLTYDQFEKKNINQYDIPYNLGKKSGYQNQAINNNKPTERTQKLLDRVNAENNKPSIF
jgi:hypothetical protein